jgi:sugar/nucleoside kinase (ribokinase family)
MSHSPRVATIGLHIADILGRPVAAIPEGQGLALLDEIRMTIAGTGAATAMDLARLGTSVATFAVVGDDVLGRWLTAALADEGVDVAGITIDSTVPTSATMLPIRPNGERPALHVIGANAKVSTDLIDWDRISGARHLHLGGSLLLEKIDGPPTAALFQEAAKRGMTTSLDVIGVPDRDYEHVFGGAYPHLDYLLVNNDDAALLSGASDVSNAIEWFLDRGVRTCAITTGPDGATIRNQGEEEFAVPAYDIDVVDTTGCGDAFSAGFIAGITRGLSLRDAAEWGVAMGSYTARALGSDASPRSLGELTEFMASTPRRPLA